MRFRQGVLQSVSVRARESALLGDDPCNAAKSEQTYKGVRPTSTGVDLLALCQCTTIPGTCQVEELQAQISQWHCFGSQATVTTDALKAGLVFCHLVTNC